MIFFCFFVALSGPEREAWKLLVLFRHSAVLRSDSIMCISASDLWGQTVDLQSWSRKGFGEEMTGTLWSGLAWSVRSSAEVSVHVSPHFFVSNDRRDRQTELRIAASWKSTISSKQQKKEQRLHSKRSPCEIRDGKFIAAKCRQKHVRGGIALLAILSYGMSSRSLARPCLADPRIPCPVW